VIAAVPVGLLATALLVVNNLRDIETDRRAGKNTLAVRTGAVVTRWLYASCVVGAFALVVVVALWRPLALIALLAIVPALPPVRRVLGGAEGRDLITALARTGMLQLAFGVLLALGIAL
jgi:1,4-dihydroxy-2-naphthoate octaprenyltransferase